MGHAPGAAATCTTAQTCTRSGCGATITAALGHNFTGATKAGSNATYCTRKCSRCSTYGVSTTTHSWSTTKAATCTATGTSTCSTCSQTKTLSALGHAPGSAATCTTAQTCTRSGCGATITAALGHNFTGATKVGSNATYCTRKCSRCSTYGVSTTTHSWSTTTAATCTAAGTSTCSTCSQTKSIAALGHSAGAAATCTTAQKCTRCNDTLAPELGHSYTSTYKAGSNATYCTRKCSRCSTYGVSSTAHSWSTTTAATCTATGTSTCSNCSQTKSIAKNSSNHTGSSVYGGTSAVHTKYSCCGATISASHTYNQNSGILYSAATCTAKQKNYKSCICGYNPKSTSYLVEVGSALGHYAEYSDDVTWGSGCLTATAEGICDTCGFYFTQTVATVQNYTRIASCTRGTWYDYTAVFTQFGESPACPDYHDAGEPAIGHSFTGTAIAGSNATYCTRQCARSSCSAYGISSTTHSWLTTTSATCTATGTTECLYCDQTKSISALGHNYTSKTTTSTYLKSSATCTAAATYYYKCSRCTAKGTSTYTSGSAKGHTTPSGQYPDCDRAIYCSVSGCGAVVMAKKTCGSTTYQVHLTSSGFLGIGKKCYEYEVCAHDYNNGTETCRRYHGYNGKISKSSCSLGSDRHLSESQIRDLPSDVDKP